MDSLTLYAAVAHAAAPPTPLHRIELAHFLAVGTHQPTPDPILLGPLLPSSLVFGRHHVYPKYRNIQTQYLWTPKCLTDQFDPIEPFV
jgi:hypothetical protein